MWQKLIDYKYFGKYCSKGWTNIFDKTFRKKRFKTERLKKYLKKYVSIIFFEGLKKDNDYFFTKRFKGLNMNFVIFEFQELEFFHLLSVEIGLLI